MTRDGGVAPCSASPSRQTAQVLCCVLHRSCSVQAHRVHGHGAGPSMPLTAQQAHPAAVVGVLQPRAGLLRPTTSHRLRYRPRVVSAKLSTSSPMHRSSSSEDSVAPQACSAVSWRRQAGACQPLTGLHTGQHRQQRSPGGPPTCQMGHSRSAQAGTWLPWSLSAISLSRMATSQSPVTGTSHHWWRLAACQPAVQNGSMYRTRALGALLDAQHDGRGRQRAHDTCREGDSVAGRALCAGTGHKRSRLTCEPAANQDQLAQLHHAVALGGDGVQPLQRPGHPCRLAVCRQVRARERLDAAPPGGGGRHRRWSWGGARGCGLAAAVPCMLSQQGCAVGLVLIYLVARDLCMQAPGLSCMAAGHCPSEKGRVQLVCGVARQARGSNVKGRNAVTPACLPACRAAAAAPCISRPLGSAGHRAGAHQARSAQVHGSRRWGVLPGRRGGRSQPGSIKGNRRPALLLSRA